MRTAPNLVPRSQRHGPLRKAGMAAIGLGVLAGAVGAFTKVAERRHPPTGRMLRVDGVRLHILELGDRSAPPVVLLHGNGAMIADWQISGIAADLARHHRVIILDRPGFGHSSRPRDRVWTASEQGRLIWRALDRLGVERPILVGHSWGTLVALAMAGQRQDRTKGIVLASGYYYPSPRIDAVLFAPQATPLIGDLLNHTINPILGSAAGPAMIARMFAPKPVTARFKAEFPLALALRPRQLRTLGEASTLMVPSARELEGNHTRLDVPTVVIAGAEDRIVSTEEQSVRLAHDLPNAELLVFPGLGHMVHHFRPDAVVDAVDRLERAGDAGPRATTSARAEAMAVA